MIRTPGPYFRNVTEWRRGGRYFKFMHTLFQKCDIIEEGWKILQVFAHIVLISEMRGNRWRDGRYLKIMRKLSLFQKCDIMEQGWKILQDYAHIVLISEM